MKTLLIVATLMLLVDDPSWAQSFFGGYGAPLSYQYFRPPSAYSEPPARPRRRAPPQQIKVSIPQPENSAIDEKYPRGSVVIVNHERYLYFVEEPGHAIRYPIAIGTPDDQWDGIQTITAKRENPRWFPSEDIQWEMGVPPMVPPGPQNPLGPRALYLGDTLYRIHGTNRPGSIGGAVSHGCFRMHNPHIIELYEKVQIGASVYVVP
jgi:lipoprotein-anchoring transpeptidase ErfK/SrfK